MSTLHIVVAIVIILLAIAAIIIGFIKEKNFKEWLKGAVAKAEKELGSGTGQLKLRWVYDLAIKQFPWVGQFISFDTFSKWVDEALEWFEDQLNKNPNIKEYIQKN